MELDEYFMRIALEEAERGYSRGDLPVGAVLVINNQLIGKSNNATKSKNDWFSHAESNLLSQFSGEIKKNPGSEVKLYTSWEPCLMCTSIASLCRITKIVYACPDPVGGIKSLDAKHLPEWYQRHWPQIKKGPFEEESYNLLIRHMEENPSIWKEFIKKFKR